MYKFLIEYLFMFMEGFFEWYSMFYFKMFIEK